MNNINKQYQCEIELSKLHNVLTIDEFQPIVKMAEEWLSQRDESKFEKTNRELLERHMDTTWLPMGWAEKFTCKFVTRFDFMEGTEKAKYWEECATNYLKNKIK
jgi:hypothetical protein